MQTAPKSDARPTLADLCSINPAAERIIRAAYYLGTADGLKLQREHDAAEDGDLPEMLQLQAD